MEVEEKKGTQIFTVEWCAAIRAYFLL